MRAPGVALLPSTPAPAPAPVRRIGKLAKGRSLPHLALGIFACLLVLVLASAEYAPHPDGASYLSIADHYAAGRWSEAVNAYWSPLLSWLLAPVIALGGDAVLAFTVIQGAAALASLALVGSLLRMVDAPRLASAAVLFGSIGVLLDASVQFFSPDLLAACLLLAYVRLAADPRVVLDRRWAVAAGAVGGLAYLAKAIALPVVVVHLLVVLGLRVVGARGSGRRQAIGAWLLCVVGLVSVAGPWVALISVQTGGPTVSTAATLNVAWALPESRGNGASEPGLVAPATDHAVSVWEHPAQLGAAGVEDVGVRQVVSGLLANVAANIVPWTARTPLAAAMRLAVAGLLVATGALLYLRRREPTIVLIGAAAALHGGAVLATYLDSRYVIAPVLLLLVVVVPPGLAVLRRRAGRRAALLGGVALTVLLVLPFVPRVAGVMAASHDHVRLGAHAAEVLRGSDIAANVDRRASMWVCAVAGCSLHGLPKSRGDAEGLRRELDAHAIDYYLVWSFGDTTRPAGAVAVEGVGEGRFRLYALHR